MKASLKLAIAALGIVALFTVFSEVVLAHHGRAGYRENSTVRGIVTEITWRNPHVYIEFDVKDDNGNVTNWKGELSAPSTMLAAGMSRTTLKPGDEIEVKGRSGLNGAPIILVQSVTKDGQAMVGYPGREGRPIQDTR